MKWIHNIEKASLKYHLVPLDGVVSDICYANSSTKRLNFCSGYLDLLSRLMFIKNKVQEGKRNDGKRVLKVQCWRSGRGLSEWTSHVLHVLPVSGTVSSLCSGFPNALNKNAPYNRHNIIRTQPERVRGRWDKSLRLPATSLTLWQ